MIALRNCQLVQTSLAKLRQAVGGGDKSYREFQIVNSSTEPLFVGAQPALGLPTIRGKVPFLTVLQNLESRNVFLKDK